MKDVSDQITLEIRNALRTPDSSTQQVAVAEKGIELAMKELTFARDRFAAGRSRHEYRGDERANLGRAGTRQSDRSLISIQCLSHQPGSRERRARTDLLSPGPLRV